MQCFLFLAEREGFEPPIPVKVCPLSRRIVSTTHAPLRAVKIRGLLIYFIRCGKDHGAAVVPLGVFIYPTFSSVVLPTSTATFSRNKLRPSESRNSISWVPGRSANFLAFSTLSAKPPST
jgi:hypothetical protein